MMMISGPQVLSLRQLGFIFIGAQKGNFYLNIFHLKIKSLCKEHKFLSELNGCKDIFDKNGATEETFLLIYSNRLIYFYSILSKYDLSCFFPNNVPSIT